MDSSKQIGDKIYTSSPAQARDDILLQWKKQGSCIVHFLYFANIVAHAAFDSTTTYSKALLEGDFLLPDGIALQLLYISTKVLENKKQGPYRLANCNGTDLTLPLLQQAGSETVIHLYGGTAKVVAKAGYFLQQQGLSLGIIQHGYDEFPLRKFGEYAKQKQILLVGRGSPLQESRIEKNRAILQSHGLLVMSVGGLFDFWSDEEKRAPKIFRGRAERLWRLMVNPKKNAIKVLYSMTLPFYIIYIALRRSIDKK